MAPLRGIARFSKPVFRVFALRWFKKNCPRLVTRWLFRQVRFNGVPPVLDETQTKLVLSEDNTKLIDVKPVPDALPPPWLKCRLQKLTP